MTITELCNALTNEQGYPFINNGEWALHDLLLHLIENYGKAHVSIATFSIAEESVRSFYLAKENFLSFRLLLDYTVKKNKIDQLLFAQSVTDYIRIMPVHAKILLFENEKINLCLVGSQNQNNVIRLEAGYLTLRTKEIQYYKNEFDKYFSSAITIL
ncbi:MAG: hypothetical protein WCR36_11720 [Bacteroidaceae bacterium]